MKIEISLEQALRHIEKWKAHQADYIKREELVYANEYDHQAVDVVVAELARVTAERDRLIEKWPNYPSTDRTVTTVYGGMFAVIGYNREHFDTREDAVRFAAGQKSEGDA